MMNDNQQATLKTLAVIFADLRKEDIAAVPAVLADGMTFAMQEARKKAGIADPWAIIFWREVDESEFMATGALYVSVFESKISRGEQSVQIALEKFRRHGISYYWSGRLIDKIMVDGICEF